MVTLKKLRREEVNQKPFLINQIFDLYGGVPGEFYYYKYQENDRWLYRDGFYFTILGIEGEYIVYTSFMMNEDYELSYMEFDNFSAALNNNGEILLWKEGSPIAQSLILQKRNRSENDFDGLLIHHQVNCNTNEELLISYKTCYRENTSFYPGEIRSPFLICFKKENKVEQYLQFITSLDYWSYDLLTIKEFGLNAFLQKGSYSLQKERSITRYFKIKGKKVDGTCILLYPFSKGYTLEEMDEMLEKKGFTRKVEEYLLNYYNGKYFEYAEYQELVKSLKKYDKHLNYELKLKKVLGSSNAKNKKRKNDEVNG